MNVNIHSQGKKFVSKPTRANETGFALIATISVMVLLVMIALAMLGLSNIELRSARQGDAMAEAKANARMAMMLAIGQLQISAGSDQRITATGWVTEENAKHRHVTGVWESWRPDPFTPSTDYDNTKEGKFIGWMASNTDFVSLEDHAFAIDQDYDDAIELLGKGTLGNAADPENSIEAGKIPVMSGKRGTVAWAVMDEGVKARVNLPFQELSGSLAERSGNLGTASRFGLEKVVSSYDPDTSQAEKLVTLESATLELAHDMKAHTHDLTAWSQGPVTNVVDGGLRQDLNLLCDRTSLPSELANARVYSGTSTGLNDADPYWQQIFEYASLYKTMANDNGLPQVAAKVPSGYTPFSEDVNRNLTGIQKKPPKGMPLMPSIAKVQVVFSLVTRLAHGPWPNAIWNNTQDSQRRYMLHMIYTPIVTLHNPYNVALKFDRMRVDFRNLPVGFNFYRNGQAQNSVVSPMNLLFVWQDTNLNSGKIFGMTLMNAGASGVPNPGNPIIMQPGEVKVFSPYLPPNHAWSPERSGRGQVYFDYRNNLSNNIQGVPGWRGEGVGFDIDWLTPRGTMTAQDEQLGVLSLKWDDTVQVAYEPFAPNAANGKFAITSKLYTGNQEYRAGVVEFDYKSGADLKAALPAPGGSSYFFPQPGEPAVTCGSMYEADATPIASYARPKAFCVFSAYAKTTNGGKARGANGEDHMDGRYFTKTWSFTNPTSNVSESDLVNEHGSHNSHEINFEPLPGAADDWIQVDSENRGNFVTGHTAFNGLKFGTHNELPITPIQSVANLQNANLASSGYLPRFDYPLANSLAHPLMTPGKVLETGSTGDPMLDHSYLLNHHLYDRFYCSTVASYQGGMFGTSGRSTQKVFEDFLKGDKPLLDHRLVPYLYSGKNSITDVVTKVVGTSAANTGYKTVAAYQMLRGEWNVNSVSVDAWKAVLAGLHKTSFPVYDAVKGSIEVKSDAEVPMSRFRLPNALRDNASSTANAEKIARWSGYRELSDDELTPLAEEIVKQVRERGPFLSLAEFVNRRLTGAEEHQLAGALQAAIDATSINDDLAQDGKEIASADVAGYKLKNPSAALGSSTQGAPGSLTQGHILNALGNAVTVRSNTFTIRSYGEAVDSNDNVLARAWCEAVVQRVPEYIDDKDEPQVKTSDLTSGANRLFGRRFRVVSFRWLNEGEV